MPPRKKSIGEAVVNPELGVVDPEPAAPKPESAVKGEIPVTLNEWTAVTDKKGAVWEAIGPLREEHVGTYTDGSVTVPAGWYLLRSGDDVKGEESLAGYKPS